MSKHPALKFDREETFMNESVHVVCNCGKCVEVNPKPKLNCDCFGWVENIGESPTVKIWEWVYCPWCSKELL